MTTPEEMAGKDPKRPLKLGDVVTYPRDCRAPNGPRYVGVLGIYDQASRMWTVGVGRYAYEENLQRVEVGEGVVVNRYPGDLNPRVNHKALREEQAAKGAALAASAVAALGTVGAILGAHESGERDASKFATLGKLLVRQVARHAVLECVPAFVFEVAK
jgi:hypothetical protein